MNEKNLKIQDTIYCIQLHIQQNYEPTETKKILERHVH